MSGYLLDTSILSILAPGRTLPHLSFTEWLTVRSDSLFVPSIAVAEIEAGICKLARAGGEQRADRLSTWLDQMIDQYGDRILPLDAATARRAGRLSDDAVARGRHPGFADVAIAAIAETHGLMLLTRNVRHFLPLGTNCADPTDVLPD